MQIDEAMYNRMPSNLQALFEKLPNPGSDEVVGLFPVQVKDGEEASAARFFYVPKASKADRDAGVDGEPRVAGGMQGRADGSMGSITLRKNHHPTVKPTELMRYLCRLVTPPGGVVLDPFMGSGSTGKAAILEGFRFIGIDLNPEYIEIAKARIQHVATRGRRNNDEQEKLF
jgi:hypothetical protein